MKVVVEGEVTDLGNVDLKGLFKEVYIVLRTDVTLILRPLKNCSVLVEE